MRALFAQDFLISNIILTFALVLLFMGFFLSFNSYSQQMALIYRERTAMEISNHLMLNCKENLGIALCDEKFISRNFFSMDAIESLGKLGIGKIGEYFDLKNTKAEISIINLEGKEILKVGDLHFGNKICINRPGILDGKIAIVGVCVD
ncbi:hypothetical protein HY989_01205 [Candidatus Micrarchaeota archaeon]|nr:hypothetical protein [Candidatus Micrarchaeota archaeon]